MEKISTQVRGGSNGGTAVTGMGPDSNYGLAECYGDLSPDDCILCYAEARTLIPTCFPNNGGRIFLDGCFLRIQNYSFYEEYQGADDTVYCGNKTSTDVFQDSVRYAVRNAVMYAPSNRHYFAQELAASGTTKESAAYVLADCWNNLNETSCTECLDRASASILRCLPSSEGRALYTGCFLRYSNTNFLNPEPTPGDNGDGNAEIQIIQSICEDHEDNNRTRFITNFFKSMEDINTKMQTSHNGTLVTGTGPSSNYVILIFLQENVSYAVLKLAILFPIAYPTMAVEFISRAALCDLGIIASLGSIQAKETEVCVPIQLEETTSLNNWHQWLYSKQYKLHQKDRTTMPELRLLYLG